MILEGRNFAFETTLSTLSYVNLLHTAKSEGYQITCLYFWLNSVEIAIKRVQSRVIEGGHDIPEEVIRRRYKSGLENFFTLYLPIWDNWLFIDNSGVSYEIVSEGGEDDYIIHNKTKWNLVKNQYDKK